MTSMCHSQYSHVLEDLRQLDSSTLLVSMITCAACGNPLVIIIEPSSDEEDGMPNGSSSTSHPIPDDVHLSCGDHFHYSRVERGTERVVPTHTPHPAHVVFVVHMSKHLYKLVQVTGYK